MVPCIGQRGGSSIIAGWRSCQLLIFPFVREVERYFVREVSRCFPLLATTHSWLIFFLLTQPSRPLGDSHVDRNLDTKRKTRNDNRPQHQLLPEAFLWFLRRTIRPQSIPSQCPGSPGQAPSSTSFLRKSPIWGQNWAMNGGREAPVSGPFITTLPLRERQT